ncbi:MAG: hypothetical protein DHS20C15_04560 [Planctomycetota bacterium]|nr:MAG: hypothetical protein DHS20C15_04560 [Planctomycetota bacterium]
MSEDSHSPLAHDADAFQIAPPAPSSSEALDPAWVPAELVTYRVLLVLLVLAGAALMAWALGFDLIGIAAALGSAALMYWLLMSLVRALVQRQFEATSWRVDDAHLRICKGVWWRRELHVPRSRIQHTDVTQGPLQRSYGVATLVVHTAGTAYSTVSLDGLTHARAQQLRDKLVLENGDDGV